MYGVKELTRNKEENVHCAQLLPYKDQLLNTEVTEKMLEFVERINYKYELVKEIMDIREIDSSYFFQEKWEGLPEKRDFT